MLRMPACETRNTKRAKMKQAGNEATQWGSDVRANGNPTTTSATDKFYKQPLILI